jgi:diaminohydroxyphosphoribosylaminopyrimidine deaminase/5-amino-6-(5-phosphoribosylamino)uracil reductase
MPVHVTLKIATGLDGRSALKSGESQWITGEAARARVQVLRAQNDAVLIGTGTLYTDNPRLTARTSPPPTVQPLRVVAGRTVRMSPDAATADCSLAPTLIVTGRRSAVEHEAALTSKGVALARVALGRDRHLSPDAILAAIAEHLGNPEVRILLEGGAKLAGAFLRAGLIDVIEWHRAPVILGADARPALALNGPERLKDVWRFDLVATERLGSDQIERYVAVKP